MRYRADKDSLAKSREKMLGRAQEEMRRRVEFLFEYYGRFEDKSDAEKLQWYRDHDMNGELQDFLMQMAALGPWQAKEAKRRLTESAMLYEKYGVVQ